jgi:hypothetical protein
VAEEGEHEEGDDSPREHYGSPGNGCRRDRGFVPPAARSRGRPRIMLTT